MEFPSKIIEQKAFYTRPRIEEHMLIVLDNCTHEEHFTQPLQTINKQLKIAVTFLTAYNRIFDYTDKNNKIYYAKTNTDKEGFFRIIILKGANIHESLNDDFKKNIIDG